MTQSERNGQKISFSWHHLRQSARGKIEPARRRAPNRLYTALACYDINASRAAVDRPSFPRRARVAWGAVGTFAAVAGMLAARTGAASFSSAAAGTAAAAKSGHRSLAKVVNLRRFADGNGYVDIVAVNAIPAVAAGTTVAAVAAVTPVAAVGTFAA